MNGFGKKYYPIGTKGQTISQEKVDIGGWANQVGERYDGNIHGKGSSYNGLNGEVYIGEFDSGHRIKGIVSNLQQDNTRKILNLIKKDGMLIRM